MTQNLEGPKAVRPRQVDRNALVISMSSHQKRAASLGLFLQSFATKPFANLPLLIWVPREIVRETKTMVRNRIPQHIHVEVLEREDVGPHSKLIHTLREFPNHSVITLDDDILYPSRTIESLLHINSWNYQSIAGNWVRKLRFGRDRKVQQVPRGIPVTTRLKKLTHGDKEIFAASPLYFAYGAGGVLYPTGSLHPEATNEKLFQALCPLEDDIWFKAMAVMAGTPIATSNWGFRPDDFAVEAAQKSGLRQRNHVRGGHVKQLRACFEYFGIDLCLEPLKQSTAQTNGGKSVANLV